MTKFRKVKRGVHIWWQPLEPRTFDTMAELYDRVMGWEPIDQARP